MSQGKRIDEGMPASLGYLSWIDLTSLQLLCGSLISVIWIRLCTKSPSDYIEYDNWWSLVSAAGAHLMGNLATNAAYAAVSSSMTLIVKACEPLSIKVFMYILNRQKTAYVHVSSLLLMCIGAFMFVSVDVSFNIFGASAAIIANLFFSVRNIIIKTNRSCCIPLYDYTYLSAYGFVILVPVVVIKYVVFHDIPRLSILESSISGISHALYNIASISVLEHVSPMTHAVLNLSKRIFAIIINIMYFHTPGFHATYVSLLVFSVGSLCYGLSIANVKESMIQKAVFVSLIAASIIGTGTWNSEYTNSKPEYHRQLKSQCVETITMSWVFDRSVPQEILSNIQDINIKNPNIPIHMYCGTSHCIEAIRNINNTDITVTFLEIDKIVHGTPLEGWFLRHPLNKILAGSNFEDHLKAAVQIALLWNFGGFYMDPTLRFDNLDIVNNNQSQSRIIKSELDTLTPNEFGILDCSYFPQHDDFIYTIAHNFADSYPRGEHTKEWPMTFDYKQLQWNQLRIYNSQHGRPEVIWAKLNKMIISNSSQNHYGILSMTKPVNRMELTNIGDDIQIYPGLQFLPFVDHILDQEALQRSHINNQITVFFNNIRVDNTTDWPPPDNINPILTSIHVEPNVQIILQKDLEYLTNRAPIGCRDTATCNIFKEMGVQAYLSGCFTLMLQNSHYRKSRTDSIYLVDVSDDAKKLLPQDILEKAIIVEPNKKSPLYNAMARYIHAYDQLDLYATAKLVITQRILWALSSKAMGTPVVLINSPDIHGGGGNKHISSSRVDRFEDLFHTIDTNTKTEVEIRNWTKEFDWNNPPANPDAGRHMRVLSTFWNVIRQHPNIYDSARKFGLLPLTSISDEITSLTFHLIFTTTKADHIVQFLSTTVVSGNFNWLNMRVIESIFYHHPFARVIVHSNTLPQDHFNVLTETGYRIRVQPYDLLEMLNDSPARDFTTNKLEEAKKGPYWYSHMCDLLRYLIIYRYGGIYMDTDMILVKPVDTLGPNILGYQLVNSVNGAFMKFEKRNNFIEECLTLIPNIYDPTVWVTIGPGLLSHVWSKWQNTNKTYRHVQVMHSNAFYLFGEGKNVKKSCFHDIGYPAEHLSGVVDRQAYGVHLNSKISGLEISKGGQLKEGTLCKKLLNDFCILCNEKH